MKHTPKVVKCMVNGGDVPPEQATAFNLGRSDGVSFQTKRALLEAEGGQKFEAKVQQRTDQGVTTPKPQTDAQKEQFRKLLKGRPDAGSFKVD